MSVYETFCTRFELIWKYTEMVDPALREESIVNNRHIHTAYNTYLLSKAYREKQRWKVILKNSEVYGQDMKDDNTFQYLLGYLLPWPRQQWRWDIRSHISWNKSDHDDNTDVFRYQLWYLLPWPRQQRWCVCSDMGWVISYHDHNSDDQISPGIFPTTTRNTFRYQLRYLQP